MHPVETYLKSLSEIHRTGGGSAEESYYGPLESLLNEIGHTLKPKVRCVSQLKNTGAGEPDFGLYTAEQFQRSKDDRPLEGALPARGVIEAKAWDDDSFLTARKEQVSKYWNRYGLVLVTNYRDFVLVGRDAEGHPVLLESYRMAKTLDAFRPLLAHPHKAAQQQGDRLLEFLRRVLLHAAPLSAPEDLAWFLASYAREARYRVEDAAALPALGGLKQALEQALGMKFEGEKGDHFFRATLVQTLFYGVFSSWVLWARSHPRFDESFGWRDAAWTLHVPMIKSLFEQIATPSRLKPLGVDEVLDWAGLVLNRVDRPSFFQKFEEQYAVQYFYEPFLKAYDPELRKELGVWYTPPEIVQYQVERVDRVLREELSLPDGLADEQVVILDPCCGTGAYLVETLRRIHMTLDEKGISALTAQKLKQAAIHRVFGFEILPAPFVVAHLQLGLMLRLLGAPLNAAGEERVGVYLTNALTGWEPPRSPKDRLEDLFPELMDERDAANRVKHSAPILVILGNPPYNAFAGTSPEEEGGLVEPYKEGLTTPVEKGGWGIKKFNLDDLYVRFFRIAERRIVKSGKGVVSFISNYSWTQEPSYVVLRKRLLESFDKFWIENMHGNRKISEYAPDGRTSETVFAIPGFSPGIRQGVVISLWVRTGEQRKSAKQRTQVMFRDDLDAARATERRRQLLDSLKIKRLESKYRSATPTRSNRFSFRPSKVAREYLAWPRVLDLSAEPPSNGLMEKRGGALMDIDRHRLEARMKAYFDPRLEWEEVKDRIGGLAIDAARYDAKSARRKLLSQEIYDPSRIREYSIRPFDVWCAYYSPVRPLWNEPRPSYWAQCWEGNSFFVTRPAGVARPEGVPVYCSSLLGDNDFQRGHAYYFPIRLREGHQTPKSPNGQGSIFEDAEEYATTRANLSVAARNYLQSLGFNDLDSDAETAGLIWMHALAVGFSPAFLSENSDGLRQDWPRVPLPESKTALLHSARLGSRVAQLLDTLKPVEGVTCGRIASELRDLGSIRKSEGSQINPAVGDLDLTAGWGRAGQGTACMPGKGKIAFRQQKDPAAAKAFGDTTLDVYLNEQAFWSNVPPAVWDYYVGGYQVIKKWLSYREKPFLRRALKIEEVEYVTDRVRRIAALLLLQPELDANYQAVKSDTYPWNPATSHPLP